LHDDYVTFAKAMKEKGTEIEFLEINDEPHDTFGAGIILGICEGGRWCSCESGNVCGECGI
jgi:hypothetical protein